MYIVKKDNGEQEAEFEELDDVVGYLRDKSDGITVTEEFEDFLLDCYGRINICGYVYGPAYALRNVDVTAYDQMYEEYVAQLINDSLDDLEYEAKQLDGDEIAEYRLTDNYVTYVKDEEVELEL